MNVSTITKIISYHCMRIEVSLHLESEYQIDKKSWISRRLLSE